MSRYLETHAGPYRRLFAMAALALAIGWAAMRWWPSPPTPPAADGDAAGQTFARWKDTSHDWLLLARPSSGELVVYDATDGRPLRRLGMADGLDGIDSIVQEGPWVFVLSRRSPTIRLLKLPQLQWVSLAAL